MDTRGLIATAYGIARSKGMNQSAWSSEAGYALNGQTVSRILKKGDCRLSTFVNLLNVIDCELVVIPREDMP